MYMCQSNEIAISGSNKVDSPFEEFQAQVIVNTQKGILLVSGFFGQKEKMTRIQKIPTCAVRLRIFVTC